MTRAVKEAATDLLFGAFIRDQRNSQRISVHQACWRSPVPITPQRWKAIEKGDVYIGARKKECEGIAGALGIDAKVVIQRAAGVAI